MNYIEKIKEPILDEMQEFERIYTKVLNTSNHLLKNVHDYIMEGSGKRLRPILTILSAKLLGKVTDQTLYGAFSLELLHTASLVHDDVVDDTNKRRSRDSVNARWSNKIAILTGDYILSQALYFANETKNIDIIREISLLGMAMSDGELMQLENTKPSMITEKEYFEIIRKKTALLFATCAKVGGISANASEEDLNHLNIYGETLGICFQIKDDIFDYYEDAHIGKPTGNDVRDGKITLPLIFALRNADEANRRNIVELIDEKNFTDENINKIMEFARDFGGLEYANRMMNEYKQKALDQLNGFPDTEVKKALQNYMEFVTERDF
jgi:octaprenyl-diphosphate synthase